MSCCDEYCANYGCNQGRDCPVRKPAKVARIGRKDYDREPLRGLPWRVYLKDLARSILLTIAAMLAVGLFVGVMRWTA